MENNRLISDAESLGATLKRARELRGIRLEEVAAATHVRISYLRAIEQNQLDQLPGLVFLKGYVRSYVEYVGLNLDEMMVLLEDFTAAREQKNSGIFSVTPRMILLWVLMLVLLLGIFFLLK